MRKLLFIVILGLTQSSCNTSEQTGIYEPLNLQAIRADWEQTKREFLQIEDIRIGTGPIAAVGRKISADIEVRYADDTLVYRGPAITYFGMIGSTIINSSLYEDGRLSDLQIGIAFGLNGMAVGGKRRFIIHPKLVCEGLGGLGNIAPNTLCQLVKRDRQKGGAIQVRKVPLTVEATLTDSCIPVFLSIVYLYSGEFRCRTSDSPKLDPTAPIWHIY